MNPPPQFNRGDEVFHTCQATGKGRRSKFQSKARRVTATIISMQWVEGQNGNSGMYRYVVEWVRDDGTVVQDRDVPGDALERVAPATADVANNTPSGPPQGQTNLQQPFMNGAAAAAVAPAQAPAVFGAGSSATAGFPIAAANRAAGLSPLLAAQAPAPPVVRSSNTAQQQQPSSATSVFGGGLNTTASSGAAAQQQQPSSATSVFGGGLNTTASSGVAAQQQQPSSATSVFGTGLNAPSGFGSATSVFGAEAGAAATNPSFGAARAQPSAPIFGTANNGTSNTGAVNPQAPAPPVVQQVQADFAVAQQVANQNPFEIIPEHGNMEAVLRVGNHLHEAYISAIFQVFSERFGGRVRFDRNGWNNLRHQDLRQEVLSLLGENADVHIILTAYTSATNEAGGDHWGGIVRIRSPGGDPANPSFRWYYVDTWDGPSEGEREERRTWVRDYLRQHGVLGNEEDIVHFNAFPPQVEGECAAAMAYVAVAIALQHLSGQPVEALQFTGTYSSTIVRTWMYEVLRSQDNIPPSANFDEMARLLQPRVNPPLYNGGNAAGVLADIYQHQMQIDVLTDAEGRAELAGITKLLAEREGSEVLLIRELVDTEDSLDYSAVGVANRNLLFSIYQDVNQSLMGRVDGVLSAASGQEDKLFAMLADWYQFDPEDYGIGGLFKYKRKTAREMLAIFATKLEFEENDDTLSKEMDDILRWYSNNLDEAFEELVKCHDMDLSVFYGTESPNDDPPGDESPDDGSSSGASKVGANGKTGSVPPLSSQSANVSKPETGTEPERLNRHLVGAGVILRGVQGRDGPVAVQNMYASLPLSTQFILTEFSNVIAGRGGAGGTVITGASHGSQMSITLQGGDYDAYPAGYHIDDAESDNLAHISFGFRGIESLEEILGDMPMTVIMNGLEMLSGFNFHLTSRYMRVMNANRLFPQDHPIRFTDVTFWGNDEEEQRQNIHRYLRAMFYSLRQDIDGIDTEFGERLRQRFRLDA